MAAISLEQARERMSSIRSKLENEADEIRSPAVRPGLLRAGVPRYARVARFSTAEWAAVRQRRMRLCCGGHGSPLRWMTR